MFNTIKYYYSTKVTTNANCSWRFMKLLQNLIRRFMKNFPSQKPTGCTVLLGDQSLRETQVRIPLLRVKEN